ncbi:extracellular solute-binding protein [Agromyces sp. G08B096]|uniref:Extracellular solute-binding protein n=1 Tax=Agromyces sp. G08B096 TaxID=3156399 RepID=A0AAU7W3F4_9MICO
MNRVIPAAAAVALAVGALAGCSSTDGGDDEITVAYQKFGNFIQLDELMKSVKEEYEAANEGITVKLVPIEAQQNDYFTKLALMNKAPSTAPDVMYEDTFMIKSDAEAGYLAPLDEYVAEWEDWEQFPENARQAGAGDDGKIYGVSMGTDTRALWYNTDILAAAGVEVPWQPKIWADVLEAAEAVKASQPDVIPLNVYSGKPQGEASVMQGFEMLLYGTEDTLYDTETQKWIVGSQGFVDSLQFIADLYQGGLGPTPEQALDTNVGNTVAGEWLPQGKLAINLDGSWLSGTWLENGNVPWPEWNEVMGQAPMPTQDGGEPGVTSMSGGWTLAMGAQSDNKDAAWEFIAMALNKENSQSYDIANSQIAVRDDVSTDPEYLEANPTFGFFSDLVQYTHFRPATSDYPQVSNEIMVAMEAVMTGQQTPEEAAAAYDEALVKIVGEEHVQD